MSFFIPEKIFSVFFLYILFSFYSTSTNVKNLLENRNLTDLNDSWCKEIKFSAHGNYIAGITKSGNVAVCNTKTGSYVATIESTDNPVHHFVMGQEDERLIATNHKGGLIKVWKVEKNKNIKMLHEWQEQEEITNISLAFGPDDSTLIANYYDYVYSYNLNTGEEEVCDMSKNLQYMPVVSFVQPEKKYLHQNSYPDDMARMISRQKSLLFDLSMFNKVDVDRVYFSPTGKHVVVTWRKEQKKGFRYYYDNGMITVLDAQTKKVCCEFMASSHGIGGLTFARDGSYFFTATDEGLVDMWHTMSGKNMSRLRHRLKSITSLTLTPDEKSVIVQAKSSFELKTIPQFLMRDRLNQARYNNNFIDLIFA